MQGGVRRRNDSGPGLGHGTNAGARRDASNRRIAWPPTLAAKRGAALQMHHLRFAQRRPASRALHCFVLDCSASMLARGQLALAKGLLIALFDRARTERAEVALIAFGGAPSGGAPSGGARAELRFGPAVPRWWNERWIEPIGGGGGTPLEAGVRRAARLLDTARRRDPSRAQHLWLFSDGRVTHWPARPRNADHVHVIDCEAGAVRVGRCAALAQAWDGECLDAHALLLA